MKHFLESAKGWITQHPYKAAFGLLCGVGGVVLAVWGLWSWAAALWGVGATGTAGKEIAGYIERDMARSLQQEKIRDATQARIVELDREARAEENRLNTEQDRAEQEGRQAAQDPGVSARDLKKQSLEGWE